MEKIAIIGAGLIGRAWSIVFARAGFAVSLFDSSQQAASAALGFIEARLPELQEAGLISDTQSAIMARITLAPTLEDALAGAVHVQENGPERVDAKAALFARMDEIAPKSTILASSTSGIPASAFTEQLRGRARCLVAHPTQGSALPQASLSSPWRRSRSLARASFTVLTSIAMASAISLLAHTSQ